MPRTSNRRWKGCPLCKMHKHAGHGDDDRMPLAVLRQYGALNASRVNRHDITADQADAVRPLIDVPVSWLPEVIPHRSRKDRRRWCRGKPGREHQPGLIYKPYWSGHGPCGWGGSWNFRERIWDTHVWRCHHVVACLDCGKILDRDPSPEHCPDRPEELAE